jgi:hypothetical protein
VRRRRRTFTAELAGDWRRNYGSTLIGHRATPG